MKISNLNHIANFLALLTITMIVQPIYASTLPNEKYSYRAKNTPLPDVLNAFSAHYGLFGVVSECFKDSFSGNIKAESGDAFLNQLSSAYNIVWFRIDSTIYFNCSNEIQTKLITLNNASSERFSNKMKNIGLDPNRFGMRALPGTGMLLVSGPPKFLEIAIDAAKAVDDSAAKEPNYQMKPYVIPLLYTHAEDRVLDDGSTTPGMVTKLRSLLGYGGEANTQGNIVADSDMNSVLIYDTESSVQRIIPLIHSMDKPKRQIEISVSIIDVAENALEDLGVDWSAQGNNGSLSVNPLSGIIEGAWHAGTGFATTLPIGTLSQFEFTLTALEQKNKARTLSRPTLLARENTRAVISNKEEFYAKVEAKEDAQLVTLSAGTELIVIPRIIPSPEGLAISLDITLTDGKRENETISDLPVIRDSTIITQATVARNQSLLIGGFYSQRNLEGSSKVPLLGDIPLLGSLFTYESSDDSRAVRMFLIRPRILEQVAGHTKQSDATKLFNNQIESEVAELRLIREAFESAWSE
ncbi:type III secretion system outer membrane ring subunit SctC [Vibrio aquimaris]|uniref:Type III secretion system outer membrane protein SpiA n=1 Tax=Vibrio aquimaris TaxID=2587862 RepID=A0A5P9CP19_9VIBR|nr:type III secretion system outer membrane ring subunit SctC [Vibrio aquimaris]QFT27723.1 Type III secretion system outer membrane protein SpiA precursor [Vibrio aquimaris]